MKIPSGIILPLMKVAALMQLPIEKLAQNFDLQLDSLIKSEYISQEQFEWLIEGLIELSPDKDFHIHFSQVFSFEHIEGAEALIVSNSTGVEALAEIFSYKALFMPLFDVKTNLNKNGDTITYASNDAIPVSNKYYYAEMVFSLIVVFGYRLLNIEHMAKRIEFRHDKQPYHEKLEALFKCPISYNAANDCAWVNPGVLQTRFVSSQKTLHDSAMEILSKRLEEERRKNSISQQVSDALFQHLDNPAISLADIASTLHLSTRSLQRLLKEENVTFNSLKQTLKIEQAKTLLIKTQQPLSHIAESLGFLESTSFFRFFKKNTGLSPRAFREKNTNTPQ